MQVIRRGACVRREVAAPAASRRPNTCSLLSCAARQGDSNNEPSESPTAGTALWRTLSEVAKSNKRATSSTNLLLTGGSEEDWKRLNDKVYKYPIQRSFTAIGAASPAFQGAAVSAVSQVVGTVHCECISQRASSGGAYLSVTVGPVWLESGEQIIQVYANLKAVEGVRWII